MKIAKYIISADGYKLLVISVYNQAISCSIRNVLEL